MDALHCNPKSIVASEEDDLILDHLLAGTACGPHSAASSLVNSNDLSSSEPPAAPIICAEAGDEPSTTQARRIRITCEEDDNAPFEYVTPAAAKVGDFLNSTSVHNLPSKSILKKTSSYDFPLVDDTSTSNHSVSFVSVEIRNYDRCAGDHPCCRSGVPLSLDWSYSRSSPRLLDEYELDRSRHRNHLDLSVNKYQRRNILEFEWGVQGEEMKAARRETKKIQWRRASTRILLPVHRAQELAMSLKQRVKSGTKLETKERGHDEISFQSCSTDEMTIHSTRSTLQRLECLDSVDTIERKQEGPSTFVAASGYDSLFLKEES